MTLLLYGYRRSDAIGQLVVLRFLILNNEKNDFREVSDQFALPGVIETTKNFVGEIGLLNAFFNIKVDGE